MASLQLPGSGLQSLAYNELPCFPRGAGKDLEEAGDVDAVAMDTEMEREGGGAGAEASWQSTPCSPHLPHLLLFSCPRAPNAQHLLGRSGPLPTRSSDLEWAGTGSFWHCSLLDQVILRQASWPL